MPREYDAKKEILGGLLSAGVICAIVAIIILVGSCTGPDEKKQKQEFGEQIELIRKQKLCESVGGKYHVTAGRENC